MAGEVFARGVDDAGASLVDEEVRHGAAGTRGHHDALEYRLPSLLLQGGRASCGRDSISPFFFPSTDPTDQIPFHRLCLFREGISLVYTIPLVRGMHGLYHIAGLESYDVHYLALVSYTDPACQQMYVHMA